jgi:hypothetical protein
MTVDTGLKLAFGEISGTSSIIWIKFFDVLQPSIMHTYAKNFKITKRILYQIKNATRGSGSRSGSCIYFSNRL